MEKGVNGTSMDDIAAKLGIAKGSLYHYIDSKHDIVYEVVRQPFEEALRRLNAVVSSREPVSDRIIQAIRTHIAIIDEFFPRTFVGLLDQISLPTSEQTAFRKIKQEYEQLWLDLIQEGMRSGAVRDDLDSRMMVFAILGMLNWMSRWYRKADRLDSRQIADLFCAIIFEGITSRASSQPDTRVG